MKVTYDDRSFRIGGRRIWIVAGEIHYFRHPRDEWNQALLRAKRAGLNTIATYVPWNFHETTEGAFDFREDKDLAAYIDLIGTMGMYAMLRPGPYICSEWDGGGIPAWLSAKPVRRFREDDPVFMAAVENWFDRLIPIIGERQMTKGGPVITIQNENEYPGGYDASMIRYVEKLNALFRKHGIDVPVLACNVHGASDTTVVVNFADDPQDQYIRPDMILTYNHHVIVEPVYALKKKQPDAPLITTEFWSGAPIYWGNQVSDWPSAPDLARAAYEYASTGTQVCYYMFEGGTNFGFWGGNNIATSYASGYPVGEGGKLTEKYYAIRPANLFAGQFGSFLADSVELPDGGGIRAAEGIRLVVREAGAGKIAFVSASDGRREAALTLPDGKRLTVHWGDVAAAVVPVQLDVFEQTTINYSNLILLAKDESRKTLIVYGAAGTDGVISINGREFVVPVLRRKVAVREAEGIRLVVADEEMARRCWIADGHIVFGPDFVGETDGGGSLEAMAGETTPAAVYLDGEGRPAVLPLEHTPRSETPPGLQIWKMNPCREVLFGDGAQGWTSIQEPLSHESLGVVQGYVWYSAELDSAADGIEKLLLTDTPNQVSVFVNGRYCGTHAACRSVRMRDEYRHPADWAFEELVVNVRKGKNRFVFLSDDLGHNYDVPVPVGIQGPVFVGSRRIEIESFVETQPLPISEDAHYFLFNRHYRKPEPLPALEFELNLDASQQGFIVLHGVKAWIMVNDEAVLPMSFPESPWTMFSEIKRWIGWKLPQSASGKRNTVRIQYIGDLPELVKENLAVYVAPNSGELTNWQWKRWEGTDDFSASQQVEDRNTEKEEHVLLLPTGSRLARKGRHLAPAYLHASFPLPVGNRPVYLNVGELYKGQIFLNGRNVGRFWRSGGTQQLYYLPRAWMMDENRLVIFEELGLSPQHVSLAFGESGRWTVNTLVIKEEEKGRTP